MGSSIRVSLADDDGSPQRVDVHASNSPPAPRAATKKRRGSTGSVGQVSVFKGKEGAPTAAPLAQWGQGNLTHLDVQAFKDEGSRWSATFAHRSDSKQ